MRRRYGDCQRSDGNCAACSLVSYGKDCKGRDISKLEWAIRAAGIDLKTISEVSGVGIRQIQRVMLGETDAGNMTARNLLALADALGVTVRDLI